MIKKKIIIWSPSFQKDGDNKTSGQSIVTSLISKEYSCAKKTVIYNKKGNNLVDYFFAVVKIFWLVLKNPNSVIYIVTSRSKIGFIRDFPALLSTFLSRGKSIIHLHGSDIVVLHKLYPKTLRLLYSKAIVVYPSPHLSKFFCDSKLGKKSICLENFLSLENKDLKIRRSNKEKGGRLNILWNSNIIRSKGIFHVARALEQLQSENSFKYSFTVAGSIIESDSQLISTKREIDLYVKKRVVNLVGPVSRSKMNSLLLEADLVPLVSQYPSECQPLSIIEAMCFGRSILCLDTPALRATVGPYPCSWISKGSDEQIKLQISSKLLSGVKIPDLEDARHARQRFSKSRFLNEFKFIKDEY